jgi:hypothetical protein
MNHFSERIRAMMKRIFKTIFGVPADSDVAAVVASETEDTPRKYVPADELPDEIRGEYVPWRTDPTGQLWMQRVSDDQALPAIHGFAPVDDDGDEELDERTRHAHQVLRDARLRNAERALRARQDAFPLDDCDELNLDDVDDERDDMQLDDVSEVDDDSEDFDDEN